MTRASGVIIDIYATDDPSRVNYASFNASESQALPRTILNYSMSGSCAVVGFNPRLIPH